MDLPEVSDREKRQATAVNCTALLIQINQTQSDISTTEKKIYNATVTLTTLNNQIVVLDKKYQANKTQSNLNNLNNYLRLANMTTNAINKMKLSRTNFITSLNLKLKDYNTYCVAAGPSPPSPCGKF